MEDYQNSRMQKDNHSQYVSYMLSPLYFALITVLFRVCAAICQDSSQMPGRAVLNFKNDPVSLFPSERKGLDIQE